MKNNNSAFSSEKHQLVFKKLSIPNVSEPKIRNGMPGTLVITWKDNSTKSIAGPSDIVFIYLYEEESKTWLEIPDAGWRMDGVFILNARGYRGRNVETYIGVRTQDARIFSRMMRLDNIRVKGDV